MNADPVRVIYFEIESRFRPRDPTRQPMGLWRPYIPFERHLQREFKTEADARDAIARLTRARANTDFRLVRVVREPVDLVDLDALAHTASLTQRRARKTKQLPEKTTPERTMLTLEAP